MIFTTNNFMIVILSWKRFIKNSTYLMILVHRRQILAKQNDARTNRTSISHSLCIV